MLTDQEIDAKKKYELRLLCKQYRDLLKKLRDKMLADAQREQTRLLDEQLGQRELEARERRNREYVIEYARTTGRLPGGL